MAREIQKDLSSLHEFIERYNIQSLMSDKDFLFFIKRVHKNYFSYLIYLSEMQNCIDKPSFSMVFSKDSFNYILESCSDVGGAFFSTFHGGYKPAKLLLRSSIETFLKGFSLDSIQGVVNEKSMYKIFDDVKNLDSFSRDDSCTFLFSRIHQEYKLLCQDVHTATAANMENISALNHFPSFNSENAEVIYKHISNLVPTYLTLLSLKFNSQYHKFHHKNKDIIITSVLRNYRGKIQNIE